MEPLLFLCHRIPFPPNKGDKIRSFHLLQHLATRYDVHLGTFIDDPADRAHVPVLEAMCASVRTVDISPLPAKVRSLTGLLRGEALTVPYYRSATLQRWVERVVREHGIRRCLAFSSSMAQFVASLSGLRVVVDFCDVDSAKWTQYAMARRWPASAIYRREGERLLAYERAVAGSCAASVFATGAESAMFARLAPESSNRVHTVENGVDTAYFSPAAGRPTPYAAGEEAVVFTGAMNYWPNVDAACWFASEILPRIVRVRPSVRFYVVGMNPTATVTALARDPRVVVTGTVPDVRPYVQHARLVVAPLRVARGIQNKVLEAMAMGRPVLVSGACADGLSGHAGREFATADGAEDFGRQVLALLSDPDAEAMGRRARLSIAAERSWPRNLTAFERLLDPAPETVRPMQQVDRVALHAR